MNNQTLSMVKALPCDGSIVVVRSIALRDYVRHMIVDIRGAETAARTTVVVVSGRDMALAHLIGICIPVIVDPAFYESVSTGFGEVVRSLAAGCNFAASMKKSMAPASGNG